MCNGLGIHSADFSAQYQDSTGRWLPGFNLPKRECLILVSGYSVALRAAIVDRWQELEAQAARPAIPNFMDPEAACEAWLVEYRGRKQAEELKGIVQAQVKLLKPRAERKPRHRGMAPASAPQAKRVIPEKPRTGTLKHWSCLPFSIQIPAAVAMWHTATWAELPRQGRV